MKNVLKRVLSVLIAIALMPTFALAAKTDSGDSDEVRFLEALNIIKPDKHSDFLWDDSPVKRAEMAEMLCNMLSLDIKTDETPKFTDTNDDNRGYIETIVNSGYMSGYGDGRFGSEDYITNEQVIKIIVYMLDADSLARQYGGYPNGYLKAATEIGILRRGYPASDAVARRVDVAKLIYNAMHYEVLQTVSIKNGTPIYKIKKGETFLTERLDIYCYNGILKSNSSTNITHPDPLDENLVQVDEEVFRDPKKLTEGMFGASVCVYVKKTDKDVYGEIIYVELDKNKIVSIDDKDIVDVSKTTVTYYEGEKKRTIKLSSVIDMVYNGTATDFDANKLKVKDGYLKLIDNDANGEFDVAMVYEYETYIVEKAYSEKEIITMQYSEPLLSLKDTTYFVYVNGEEATLDDIKKGYVLSVTKSENSEGEVYGIYASTQTVNGQIQATKESEKQVKISGEVYELSDYYTNLTGKGKIAKLQAGEGGVFVLNIKGEIVMLKQNGDDTVAFLADAGIEDNVFEKQISVKLFTSKSKFEVFKIDDTTKVTIKGQTLKTKNLAANTEFMEQIKTRQLVTYTEKDGVLKTIELCGKVKDKDDTRFSLDDTGSFDVTSKGIVNYKYRVDNDTIVYNVPSNSSYYDKVEYYQVQNGSAITDTNLSLMLYDVDEYGYVKYIVWSRDPQWSEIGNGNGVNIISSISEGINADGEDIIIFEGYGQSGDPIKFQSDNLSDARKVVKVRTYDEDGNVSSVSMAYTSDMNIKIGDVVQYKLNRGGNLHSIVQQHSIDQTQLYSQEKLEIVSNKGISDTMFGRCIKNNGSQLILNFVENGKAGDDENQQIVSNTGKAVYRVYNGTSGRKVAPIKFHEIMPGDRVYACIGNDNTARIIVVYE